MSGGRTSDVPKDHRRGHSDPRSARGEPGFPPHRSLVSGSARLTRLPAESNGSLECLWDWLVVWIPHLLLGNMWSLLVSFCFRTLQLGKVMHFPTRLQENKRLWHRGVEPFSSSSFMEKPGVFNHAPLGCCLDPGWLGCLCTVSISPGPCPARYCSAANYRVQDRFFSMDVAFPGMEQLEWPLCLVPHWDPSSMFFIRLAKSFWGPGKRVSSISPFRNLQKWLQRMPTS